MDVASLIVRIGADVSSLEAGLSRAQQMTEAAAARLARGAQEAGQAEVQAANEAAAAQKQVAAALDSLRAKYAEMKGDFRSSMELKFPKASAADLDSLTQAKTAITQLKDEMAAARPTMEGFASSFAMQQLGQGMADFGAKGLGVIKDLVASGSNLQKAQADVMGNTLLDPKELQAFSAEVNKLGSTEPVGLEEIWKAVFRISNEGFHGADAMKVLDVAVKAAAVTGANAGDVGNALAQTLISMGLKAGDAARVMNELHIAAADGNMSLQDFAGVMSRVHSIAHQFKVPLEDVDAVLSTLTRHGFDAARSATGVAGMFSHIEAPAQKVIKLIGELKTKGIDLSEAFSARGLEKFGLTGIIEQIRAAADKLNVNPSELANKLIPAMRGGIQTGELVTTDTLPDLEKEHAKLKQAMTGANDPLTAQHVERMKALSSQLQILKNEYEQLGSDLLSVFGPTLKRVTGFVHDMAEAFKKLPSGAKETIAWTTTIGLGFAFVAGKVIALLAQLKLLSGAGGIAALLGKGAGATAGATAGGAGAVEGGAAAVGGAAAGVGLGTIGAAATVGAAATGTLALFLHNLREHGPVGSFVADALGAGIPGAGLLELGASKMGLFGNSGATVRQLKPGEAPNGDHGAPDLRAIKDLPRSTPPAKHHEYDNLADKLKSSGPSKEFLKEQKAAMAETLKLEAELQALHGGHAKAVGDLAAKYHLLPPAILKHIEALRHERDAFTAHQKELAATAKERVKYADAVKDAETKIADLHAQYGDQKKATPQFSDSNVKLKDGFLTLGSVDPGRMTGGFLSLGNAQIKVKDGFLTLTGAANKANVDLKSHSELIEKLTKAYPHYNRQQLEYLAGLQLQPRALEKAHQEAEKHAAALRKLADEQTALVDKARQEASVAQAGLAALRTGDVAGLLRAEHLGVDDATIGKLSAYQQQLLGIKNATEAIKARTSPIIDPATKNALEALKRYAGTGNLEAQQAQGEANQLNQIARTLNQYQAGSGGGADGAQRLNFLKQGAFPPEMLETLKKAVGDVDVFFGGIKNESQQAADAIAVANKSNQEAAMAYLTATKDWGTGLVRNLASMDAMIHDIGQAAAAALRSSGGGVSGARAMGGSVSGGSSYLVGERGPEIFTPGASGNITPNSALGGGDTHVHVNMVVHAADAASFHRSQGQMMQNLGRAVERHMSRNG